MPRTGGGEQAAARAARLEVEAEDVGERLRGGRAHVVDRDRPAELARQRRERVPVEPARGDPLA